MSGEGALKRLKLGVPMHRLRVYPRENPQPRETPREQQRCGTTEANRGPSWSVGPCPSSQCGTRTRDQSRWYRDKQSTRSLRTDKIDLHQLHNFFHNQTEEATKGPSWSVGPCSSSQCVPLSCRAQLLVPKQTIVMSSITEIGRICTICTISSTIEEQQQQRET